VNNRRALFVQAVRGPILLMTIGVLFAVQQAGILNFSRTWPLILIVIGVTKLMERAVSSPPPFLPPSPPPPPPPGGFPR
jgi:hypothetical protein